MINDIDESRAPLLDHLLELRRRLLWSIAALAVAFGICLYFARPIFAFLVQPLVRAGQGKIIYTQIFEANRDQLSDPDKIKPGQVLKLPA